MAYYYPRYAPEHTSTYVLASSTFSSNRYLPQYGEDPFRSLTGAGLDNSWFSSMPCTLPQKFNIDHGSGFIASRIMIDNYHDSGSNTNYGIRNFSVYGTNSATAFSNTDGTDTTDLTLLGTYEIPAHVASNTSDPQYFDIVGNSTSYRYTVIIISTVWIGTNAGMGFRRVTLYSTETVANTVVSTSYSTYFPFIIKYVGDLYDESRSYYVTDTWFKNILGISTSTEYNNYIMEQPSWNVIALDDYFVRKGSTYKGYNITHFNNVEGSISGRVTVENVKWPEAVVRLYYNVDGQLVDSTLTDSEGEFSFNYLGVGEAVFSVIAYKDGYNAIIYDKVSPVAS